ncbi:MAG: lamin tail domain-containing protein, partial [Verrucomicrobiales bacterium]|nr:lamin tail domain-containing protein [Verrucomicrobiales bacterium]
IINPLIVDEFTRRLWIDMGHVGVRGIFTSLYLNGSFKGAFNLCERIREPMFQEHYKSDLPWDVRYVNDWVNGTPDAFDAMMVALGRNLGSLTNYQEATEHFDPVNFADYYLLNIYAAMWDWPLNNFAFARERSGTDLGRFRYAVWDAEGGFDSQSYYNHPPSYNSITADLEPNPQDVPSIWRALTDSPEFRLLFADRVQRHMFNTGLLDDRSPSGPFDEHKDALVREASSLIRFIEGTALDQSWYTTWTHPTNGRRAHLLDRGMLRDAGLWPLTGAPVLNQHGGDVSPGFQVTLTSPQTVYFTTGGSDPRLPGGAVSPAAQTYTAPLTINSITTLKARALNSDGEWSPLTEATFVADTSGLQITEIMYNPAGNSLAEFLEITNTGPISIGLTGLQFTRGINFDFASSTITSLTPGARLLIVRDLATFRATYGEDLDHLIAGTFQNSTALSNSGETVTLSTASGETVLSLTYDDALPFPKSADGLGHSLVPTFQSSTPWRPSTAPGGTPGTSDKIPFTGTDPSGYYLANIALSDTLVVTRNLGADDADHIIESSADAVIWQPAELLLVSRTLTSKGEALSYQIPQSLTPAHFYRLRITVP